MTRDARAADPRLEQALALLRSVLLEADDRDDDLAPWEDPELQLPSRGPRFSATDNLSWWFRPGVGRDGNWDTYFGDAPSSPPRAPVAPSLEQTDPTALAPRVALRLLLAEPEEELLDEDADTVVECLYAFIHAIGRRDVVGAMACVSEDFHMLEDDREVDRRGLESKIRYMLGSLRGWDFEIGLVEIPQPIAHPDGILVYTESLVDARRGERDRRTIAERRMALFTRQADRTWRLAALPAVQWPTS